MDSSMLNTLVSVIVIALLFFFMMRGCGGGMGSCGMPMRGRSRRTTKQEPSDENRSART
jgi:hypothetical protein